MYTAMAGLSNVDAGETRDQPICDLAKACRSQFVQIVQLDSSDQEAELKARLSTLFDTYQSKRSILNLSDLLDEYEQFRVWARNLGVFSSDHSSLDYRLREAPEVRDGVLSLLRSLLKDLQECFALLKEDRAFDDNEGSDSSDSGSDTRMEFGEQLPPTIKFTIYELQNRLRNTSDATSNLMKLAELIRGSGARSRAVRAEKYEHIVDGINHTLLFENNFLPLVLKHRFKLEEPLLQRFRKAIASRRRRFLYQAKHQKRLAFGDDSKLETINRAARKLEPQTTTTSAPVNPISRSLVPTKQIIDGRTDAPTRATTFRIGQKTKVPSAIISTSTKFDPSAADLPPPPALPSSNATHFECPYCCLLVPATKCEKSAWKQHVIADLQPFLCVELNCRTPDTIFETRDDWIDHQKQEHSIEWWCEGNDDEHAALKFSTEADFIAHLRQSHSSLLPPMALKNRVEMAGHPSLTPFTCCPFCDFLPADLSALNFNESDAVFRTTLSQKMFQDHLASEMLRIFLIALPEREDLEDNIRDTDTERSLGSRSTVSSLEAEEDASADWLTREIQRTTYQGRRIVADEVWDPYYQEVRRLCLEKQPPLSLEELISHIRDKYAFVATKQQWKDRLIKWNVKRFLDRGTAAIILHLLKDAETQQIPRRIFHNGHERSMRHIQQYIKKSQFLSNEEDLLCHLPEREFWPSSITWVDDNVALPPIPPPLEHSAGIFQSPSGAFGSYSFGEQSMVPDVTTDTEAISDLWAAVWASPQLRRSVRESYAGPCQDEAIKSIAMHQNQQDHL